MQVLVRSVVNQSPYAVTVGDNPKSLFVLRNKGILIRVERDVPSMYVCMYLVPRVNNNLLLTLACTGKSFPGTKVSIILQIVKYLFYLC